MVKPPPSFSRFEIHISCEAKEDKIDLPIHPRWRNDKDNDNENDHSGSDSLSGMTVTWADTP